MSAGCCREGFNLFRKVGSKNFFKRGILGDKWARSYVLQDTFGRFLCAIIGHSKTFLIDDLEPLGDRCCYRCFKVIKS